jgi:hypothetical protein
MRAAVKRMFAGCDEVSLERRMGGDRVRGRGTGGQDKQDGTGEIKRINTNKLDASYDTAQLTGHPLTILDQSSPSPGRSVFVAAAEGCISTSAAGSRPRPKPWHGFRAAARQRQARRSAVWPAVAEFRGYPAESVNQA